MLIIMNLALVSGFLIIYHHALYPLLLKLLARLVKSQDKPEVAQTCKPSIHIIVPAYNEAQYIAEKIRSLCELDYPQSLLRVSIIGDGCRDDTMAIARQTKQQLGELACSIEVEEHQQNRGKVAVINQAIQDSNSEIIALSDVSAMINAKALQNAAVYFQNAKVGVVNSHYCFDQSTPGEAAYWQYQSNIKRMEYQTGSVLGAHGALYFIRRSLCQPLHPDTINDDFVLPMQAVAQGYTAVQADDIVATELETAKSGNENSRRMRIAAGNLQQLTWLYKLLLPTYKGTAFNFFSGKALRVLMPWCLLLFFICCSLLATHNVLFALLALGQCVFYSIALLQHRSDKSIPLPGSSVIYYFAAGHWFSLLGMYRYLTGSQKFRV